MKNINISYVLMLVTTIALSSCVNDLDVEPIDPNVSTSNNVFKDELAYKQALAKVYASYAVSSQTADGTEPDIAGIDANFGNYLRQLWGLQQLSTDEAIIAWDDATIKNFHWQTWSPNDVFIAALYSRIYYSISIANEFIRNADDAIENGASGTFLTDLENYKQEARFLRAFSYWHAIDMFGNVPFVTEVNAPGAFFPERIVRADLFTYLETELLDIASKIVSAGANEYARADQGAVWMLLSKLYLNAKVYTGTEKNTDALTYINKVIGSTYTLDAVYENLFRADNHISNEIIYSIAFDGTNTQQYGGMTFLLHASNGGGMPLNGIDSGWGGIRAIKDLANKFGVSATDFSSGDPEFSDIVDKRGMFYYNPSSWEWDITNVGTFTEGIGVTKFKNISSDGGDAPNVHPTFVSTDFPVFRLGDAYLMYAEAVVRGGSGGDAATALGYVNDLRTRAGAPTITSGGMTLPFLLDERARELYWEGHRRTDLIRFEQFSNGSYVWEWKGNTQAGTSTDSFRDLYPIPSNDLNANPNLIQNDGY